MNITHNEQPIAMQKVSNLHSASSIPGPSYGMPEKLCLRELEERV